MPRLELFLFLGCTRLNTADCLQAASRPAAWALQEEMLHSQGSAEEGWVPVEFESPLNITAWLRTTPHTLSAWSRTRGPHVSLLMLGRGRGVNFALERIESKRVSVWLCSAVQKVFWGEDWPVLRLAGRLHPDAHPGLCGRHHRFPHGWAITVDDNIPR